MSSTEIRYADYLGWTFVPAVVASAIFVATDLILLFNLVRCKTRPARPTFYIMIAWATFRAAGMISRALLTTDAFASNLGLLITAEVLMSVALLPLVRTLSANLVRVNKSIIHLKHGHGQNQGQGQASASHRVNSLGRRELGKLDRIQGASSILLFIIITALITGAVWILNTPPGVPVDPTATTLRLAGSWGIAVFTWIQFAVCGWTLLEALRLPRPAQSGSYVVANSSILVLQVVMLIVRTGYGLYSNGAVGTAPAVIPEATFYVLSLLPELVYASPFLMPRQVEKLEPASDETEKQADTSNI
ncbi:uncharacterized protein BJ171DRAFT_514399 [Polychytrium aggregatum]|uniref:uncharacterized protein n=1 Tax=Polychytrium aggregatum TaxID=110093 RepID=UPI0022FED80E|nr:uncharacterized protein BJ171DRAFT_514399 [Polychytrium aggregatum]KAI9202489.1 hypothetical protein BJ171DRAFT_514399 [Polychytrium aggregatum]